MNHNVLRYFSVLAQVEHYTVAAARLGISQLSLSSAIHNLENALGGVKLFEKVGRNIRKHPGVHYAPLKNWHQALYMCILYDKWPEPPVWDFVELIVKTVRSNI